MAKHKGKKRRDARKAGGPDIPTIVLPFIDLAARSADVVMQDTDPEGPHQVRVGLRKLRTALSVFGRRHKDVQPMRGEARDIAAILGELRDLDVVRQEILAPFLQAHPGASGFEGLDAALSDAADDARARVRAMLASGRLDAVLGKARGWLAGQAGRPAARPADKALRRRFRKAQRYGWQFAALDVERRHAFRKELKKIRYTLDCGAWAGGDRDRKAFVKKLKALQNTLGAMNDAAAAEHVLMRFAAGAGVAERAAAGQIVACLGARSVTELTRTTDLWAALEARAPDWL